MTNLKTIGDRLWDVQETEEYSARIELIKTIKKNIFKLEYIDEILKESDLVVNGEGEKYQSVYIGSVLHWLPSGKYYTFWSDSNVEKWEIELDGIWMETAEKELETIGAFLVCGKGNATDLFIQRGIEEDF